MVDHVDLRKGISFACLAAFCYSTIYLFASFLTLRFSLFQILFLQNCIASLFLTPHLHPQRLKTPHWKMHLLRSLCGISGNYCIFYALHTLSVVDVMTLNLLAPFIIPLLSFWWLKETLHKQIWWAIGLGFAGAIIVLKPTWNFFHLGSFLALASAGTSAIALTAIRYLNVQGESQERILSYLFLSGVLLSFPGACSFWITPNFQEITIFLSLGVLTILNQMLTIKAFQCGPAHIIATIGYFAIVFAALLNWLFHGNSMGWETIIGALLVVGGGLSIRFVSHKKGADLRQL